MHSIFIALNRLLTVSQLLLWASIHQIWTLCKNHHVKLMKVLSQDGCSSGKFSISNPNYHIPATDCHSCLLRFTVTWPLVVMSVLLLSELPHGGSCTRKLAHKWTTGNWHITWLALVAAMNSAASTAKFSTIHIQWQWPCQYWLPLKCWTQWTGKFPDPLTMSLECL